MDRKVVQNGVKCIIFRKRCFHGDDFRSNENRTNLYWFPERVLLVNRVEKRQREGKIGTS